MRSVCGYRVHLFLMDEGQNSKSGSSFAEPKQQRGADTKAAKKEALAAKLSLARDTGRLKRMASSFPGPLVDVPLQPRPEGPLPSRSPNLVSQLAARIRDTPTLSRRALAAELSARITSQRRLSAQQVGRFIHRVWVRVKVKARRGRSRLALQESMERKAWAAGHTQRVKDCLEEEMAVLKEFREKVERKRRCGKGAILAKGQGAPPLYRGRRPRMSLKVGKWGGRRVS